MRYAIDYNSEIFLGLSLSVVLLRVIYHLQKFFPSLQKFPPLQKLRNLQSNNIPYRDSRFGHIKDLFKNITGYFNSISIMAPKSWLFTEPLNIIYPTTSFLLKAAKSEIFFFLREMIIIYGVSFNVCNY